MRTVGFVLVVLIATSFGLSACKSDAERVHNAIEWCDKAPKSKGEFIKAYDKAFKPEAGKCAALLGCDAIFKCLREQTKR